MGSAFIRLIAVRAERPLLPSDPGPVKLACNLTARTKASAQAL
jgi:hypothetical protein